MTDTLNAVRLAGTVHGDSWTRYPPGGRPMQVRFWLQVSASDVLLCVVECPDVHQGIRLECEVRGGRHVAVTASARASMSGAVDEARPGVVFYVSGLVLDGVDMDAWWTQIQAQRRHCVRGKMAAAGEEVFQS